MYLRPATAEDRTRLELLLRDAEFNHRHLDWRTSLDWLGYSPFWFALDERRPEKPEAALACPPEIPNHTWIRLLCATDAEALTRSFAPLLEKTFAELQPGTWLNAVGLQNWLSELLMGHHFHHHQNIVILEWNNRLPPLRSLPAGLHIRRMELQDLDAVHMIDNLAFEPLWQNSREEVLRSLVQSAYSTVIEEDERILGYQISTGSFFNAHLARLAVHPDVQQQSLGYLLVQDLLQYFRRHAMDRVTVNTQHNNSRSLALYKKIGFELTGETFPVYSRQN